MSIFEYIIQGIVQGLTEFLPISSSGHTEIFRHFFGYDLSGKHNLILSTMLHLSTALSSIIFFRKQIWSYIVSFCKEFSYKNPLSLIIIADIPICVVGILYKEYIESIFDTNLPTICFMLFITAVLLIFTYLKKNGRKKITPIKALIIGVAQVIAIIPGISRSGTTIACALLLGIRQKKAAEFSFLIVLLPIIGASCLEIIDILIHPSNVIGSNLNIGYLIIAMIMSTITGLIACKWMIKIIEKSKLYYFSIYCLVVSISIGLYLING